MMGAYARRRQPKVTKVDAVKTLLCFLAAREKCMELKSLLYIILKNLQWLKSDTHLTITKKV